MLGGDYYITLTRRNKTTGSYTPQQHRSRDTSFSTCFYPVPRCRGGQESERKEIFCVIYAGDQQVPPSALLYGYRQDSRENRHPRYMQH